MTAIFLSYDARNDEYWRVRFLDVYGHTHTVNHVQPGDLGAHEADGYIDHLVQDGWMEPEDVMIVLLGPRTYSLRKVDWDVAAALRPKPLRASGLLVMRLPTHEDHGKSTINPRRAPGRIVDNIQSGYINVFDWIESEQDLQTRLYGALKNARENSRLVRNDRALMEKDMFRE